MSPLLNPGLTNRLEQFKLVTKVSVRGGHKGERRSKRLGSSLEFSDFRPYHPGDDLRQIDWNTFARSGKYFIKRFLDEQELDVHVYLDCTKSMAVTETKWERAKQLTAVFSFLSLANGDRLRLLPIGTPGDQLPETKGKALVNRALSYMENLPPATNELQFGEQFLSVTKQSVRGGLHVVISDLLDDPGDFFKALKIMMAKRQQVIVLQVVLPEEKHPDYVGDLKLTDVETGGERDVSMTARVISNYQQLFTEHESKLQSFCKARGIEFIQCPTSETLEKTVFSLIMGRGWIGR